MAYSFETDDETLAAIAELKPTFGVRTNAQVIRKALALAWVAVRHADKDKVLTIRNRQGGETLVLLAG